MTDTRIDPAQRRAAIVVGWAYLVAMAASVVGEGARGLLVVTSDAALTAQQIMASPWLFRLGLGSELVTFAIDVALITALYVILAPVNRHLALLALGFRLMETAVLLTMTAHGFDVLRLLGSAEYLRAFDASQLQALARVAIGGHTTTYNVGFVFLGLGSTTFAILWRRSGYVPRALGTFGVFASVVLGVGAFTFLVWPALTPVVFPAYMLPIAVFELGMGIWMVAKGLRESPTGITPAAGTADSRP